MQKNLFGSTFAGNFDGRNATHSAGRGEVFHDWFPYLEGFSSGFVNDILTQKFDAPKLLLEPFCGVGTTPLTLAQMGVSCGYCEVNPFLLELVKAKSVAFTFSRRKKKKVDDEFSQISEKITGFVKKVTPDADLSTSFQDTFGDVKYFSEPNKTTVLKLKTVEKELIGKTIKPFYRVIVASSLLEASLLKRAGDVKYKTKKDLIEGVPDIIKLIKTKIEILQRDITKLPDNARFGEVFLFSENAKDLVQHKNQKFEGVITSPPYLNGTNYIRNTKLELWYLGYLSNKADLRNYRGSVVTSAINDVSKASGLSVIDEAKEVVRKIESNCYDKRIPRMVAAYFDHMKLIAKGIYKNLIDAAPVCIDIGDSVYGGEHVPTHDILADVFSSSGFKYENSVILRKRFSNQGAPLTQRLLFFRKK